MSWTEALDIYLDKAPEKFTMKWRVFDREVRSVGGVKPMPIQYKIAELISRGLSVTQATSCSCSREVSR